MDKILTLIARHKSFLLAFNAAVLVLAIAKLVFSTPQWTAQAQLILPDNSGNLDANLGTLGSLESGEVNFSNTLDPLKAQQSILLSNPVLNEVYTQDPKREKFARLAKYKELFGVEIEEKSNTLALNITGPDPELAKQRASRWIESYQNRLNDLRQVDRQSRASFNDEQITAARQRLNQAEQDLAKFKRNYRLIDTNQQTSNLVKAVGEMTSLQQQAIVKAKANQQQIETISARLALNPDRAIRSLGLAEDRDYQFMKNKLVQVETNLSELRANFTDNEPRIQNLLSERKELQQRIQQHLATTGAADVDQLDTTIGSDREGRSTLIQQLVLLESEAESNQKEAEQLAIEIEKTNQQLESIPENQAALLQLEREKNIAEGIYQGLVAQVQQVGINSFNTYPNVQVIDPPETDSQPTSPDKKIIIFSFLLASTLGSAAIVFWLENQNPLLEPKDLLAHEFSTIVCIPRFKVSNVPFDLPFAVRIEFEKLASAISRQSQTDNRILITSSIAGEGKTTTTLGLAQALIDLGFHVLMVDADYHQSALTKRLGFTPRQSDRPEEIQPNLDLLVAAPQSEKVAALVSKGQFQEKIVRAESCGKYDYILIDTPPIGLTSETVMMSVGIPNTLFVIRQGFSQRDVVKNSLNQLTHHGARLMGLVVNDVKSLPQSYPNNYYLNSDNVSDSKGAIVVQSNK
jgi:polysaccharide biosynthesis transport protein